jgi:hypothetical protein
LRPGAVRLREDVLKNDSAEEFLPPIIEALFLFASGSR